ncbi:hypothetical protein ACIOHE_07460 [Streptomyces sp. NPDC087851]|uniref:hypothetical protein n=1 Tax=Streptomyces sp. NPDC087851 TaxID=3365810 RepID=UPI003803656F
MERVRATLRRRVGVAEKGLREGGNLTDLALADNIELGVVLRDPTLVRSLVEHFRRLIAPENAPVRLA